MPEVPTTVLIMKLFSPNMEDVTDEYLKLIRVPYKPIFDTS
jgi:hypothetical protein